jgi:TrmH family RNA methyltransferase
MVPTYISSPSNQTIKDLVRLKDRKGERSDRFFVVEGAREIDRAVKSGFEIAELYVCEEVLNDTSRKVAEKLKSVRTTSVDSVVFAKLAVRESTDGIIAVFKIKQQSIIQLKPKDSHGRWLVLAVENIEKPGNLGALLRTADAVGVDFIVMLGQSVDPWNQNCVRSSLGGIFSIPVFAMSRHDFFDWSAKNEVKTIAAALVEKSVGLYSTDLSGHVAVVLGNEATGLSREVIDRCSLTAVIPMKGICDSLNVSVAGAVMTYEILRQRTL